MKGIKIPKQIINQIKEADLYNKFLAPLESHEGYATLCNKILLYKYREEKYPAGTCYNKNCEICRAYDAMLEGSEEIKSWYYKEYQQLLKELGIIWD